MLCIGACVSYMSRDGGLITISHVIKSGAPEPILLAEYMWYLHRLRCNARVVKLHQMTLTATSSAADLAKLRPHVGSQDYLPFM